MKNYHARVTRDPNKRCVLGLVGQIESYFSPVRIYMVVLNGGHSIVSVVFITFPYMVRKTMSSPTQQDPFDSALDGRAANDRAYIDQADTSTEEELWSFSDDDSLHGELDDLRVEDEDWEMAERGSSPPVSPRAPDPRLTRYFCQISLNSTIDFGNTSPCVPATILQGPFKHLLRSPLLLPFPSSTDQ